LYPRTCQNVTERGEIVAAHHHVLLARPRNRRIAPDFAKAAVARFSEPLPISSVKLVLAWIKAFSAILD